MFPAAGNHDFWKGGGDAETDDEPDFYFTSGSQPPPPPPPSAGVPRTPSWSMHTPDISFNVFDDSNSLDTTPRIGKKTEGKQEQGVPTDSLFPSASAFPSEEFLSEISQQLEKHSFNNRDDRGGIIFGPDGFVPGFDSPSLESLTLNPFLNDGHIHASDSLTTATSKSASYDVPSPNDDEMSLPTATQGAPGACGLSPIPIRDAAAVAAFDPFAFGGSQGGDRSPLQVWTDRAKQTIAKVTASESHDECDGNVNSNGDRIDLFSKDLIATEYESVADATRDKGEAKKPPHASPPPSPLEKTALPSLYSTADKREGEDEVPSLEWSFTSNNSFGSAASSGAASRAGQFLSHVVGRCYGCSDEDADANLREQQHATFVQQLHDVKQKSASVVDETMRVVVALLGDTVPSLVAAMTAKSSSRSRDDGPLRTARRHRRFPSASTYDYSESQNPITAAEMSHYTTSDGEGTSFDDDYYDGDEDDEYEDDEDDASQSSARGGSAVGGSFDASREGADGLAEERHGDMDGDDGSAFYSPRVKNGPPNGPPRARLDGIRKGSSRRKSTESVSPSFNTASSSTTSDSWMKDPLVKVNQGVQKLFGGAAVALSHPSDPRVVSKHRPSAASAEAKEQRRRDEMERAQDRFAC